MAKRKMRMLAEVLLVLFLGMLAMAIFRPSRVSEPVYQGKKLGAWLDIANVQTASVSPSEAMQHLGTNAVPWLLSEASAHEIGLLGMIKEWLNHHHLVRMHLRTASEHQARARLGFSLLGDLGGTALAQGLTNSDPWIRFGCVGQWEVGQNYPKNYIPALLNSLEDKEPMVRSRAANAIGMIHPQPEKVVPILIHLLDDHDQGVSCMAALGLSLYTTNAKMAVPALLKHLSNCTPDFKFFATNALKAIGPATNK